MSGVAIKMGVYGIIRFSGWLPVPPAAGWVVLGLGATSALLGIAFAFAQNDVKRLLAYCSVENIGIIMIGVGAALLAVTHGDAPWGRLALAGALLHVWNHGAFKSLLFFGAGHGVYLGSIIYSAVQVIHAKGECELRCLPAQHRPVGFQVLKVVHEDAGYGIQPQVFHYCSLGYVRHIIALVAELQWYKAVEASCFIL